MKHPLRALSQRNFRLYFIGQSASFVGTWMQQIALAWLIYRMTGSPFMLGLATFAGNIPILFLAPFGGVWSDRIDRRRAMLLTQALSLLQAAVLAGLTFAGLIEVWHLLAAAAFLGIVNAFDTPLRQAGMRPSGMPVDGLAPCGLNILSHVCLGPSGLRAPVSCGVSSVSSRTLVNHVG